MSRRMMGAGNAGASNKIRLNGITIGDKLQGLPSTIGRVGGIKYNGSYGNNRDFVFKINQLGGIGKKKTMFLPGADGVSKFDEGNYNDINKIPPTQSQNVAVGISYFYATDDNFYDALQIYFGEKRTGTYQFTGDELAAIGNYNDDSTKTYIENWNVTAVTNMGSAFSGESTSTPNRKEFNQSLKAWTVNNVTNMTKMFYKRTKNLNDIGIKYWNTTSLKDVSFMFADSAIDNNDLKNLGTGIFNTKNVTTMEGMFENCSSLTDVDKLEYWSKYVDKVKDMTHMFRGCINLTKLDQLQYWKVNADVILTQMFDPERSDTYENIDETGTPNSLFFLST